MAMYIDSEIGCDIPGCQNHSRATLRVRGVNQPGDSSGLNLFTMPSGWAFKRLHWWHLEESILCPEHNK